ncbi:cytochrome c oxidase subunit VA-domain-containing protein [Dipodascopsis uninucleata]
MASIIRSSLRNSASRFVLSARVARPTLIATPKFNFVRNYSAHEESYDEFNARFQKEFEKAYDAFEVQRILTNCFAYDHVPSPTVIIKALEAARRVDDFATAVRVFEAIKLKVPRKEHYNAYLEELKDVRESLGVPLKEELFPEN